MFGPSTPIEKQSTQYLRFIMIAIPLLCLIPAIGFAYAASCLGWSWKGIVCGLASGWMLAMMILAINGIRRELKRRSKTEIV